jgi:hypothetical protein
LPKDLSPAENESLERWIVALRDALETTDADLPLDDVLRLTGDVAHAVVRPAVPPTAYLMGYHVGRAVAGGEDQRAALHRALDTVAALVPADRDDPEEN